MALGSGDTYAYADTLVTTGVVCRVCVWLRTAGICERDIFYYRGGGRSGKKSGICLASIKSYYKKAKTHVISTHLI